MRRRWDVQLELRLAGGVEDLGRIVTLLALHGLSPRRLSALDSIGTLRVRISLAAAREAVDRCLARILKLVALREARVREGPNGPWVRVRRESDI
jgi:hypothetical protein